MVGRRVKLALAGAQPERKPKVPARKAYVPGEMKDCGHTNCQLQDWERCCACWDKRKTAKGSDLFLRYVDGIGWKRSAHRAEYYCPSCRSELDPCLDDEVPYKVCGHNYCELITPNGCCSCLDKRMDQAGYAHYVSLHGYLPEGSRYADYCRSCAVFHAEPVPDSPVSYYSENDSPPSHPLDFTYLAPPHASHRFKHSADRFPDPPKRKPYRRTINGSNVAATSRPNSKACGANHFCALDSTDQCCACADTRAVAPAYPEYIDGIGEVLTAFRWKNYCFVCRAESAKRAVTKPNPAAKVEKGKGQDISFADAPHPRETRVSSPPPQLPASPLPPASIRAPRSAASEVDVEEYEDESGMSVSNYSRFDTDDEWGRFSEAGMSDWNGLTDIEDLDSVANGDDDDEGEGSDEASHHGARSRAGRMARSVLSESGFSEWNSVAGDDDWSVVSDVG